MWFSKSNVFLMFWLCMVRRSTAGRVNSDAELVHHAKSSHGDLGSTKAESHELEEANAKETSEFGRGFCSKTLIDDCSSPCMVASIKTGDYEKAWCVPTTCNAASESLCESPWCRWLDGDGGGKCVPFRSMPLFGLKYEDVTLPLWRPVDFNPSGFRIPKLPCGPGVGEVTKNYIVQRYGKSWETYWNRDVRNFLYLNGHVLALNGCKECTVFDTHSVLDQDYFVENRDFNELVVACRPRGCSSPNFFVERASYGSYCHPCPQECDSCLKHSFGKLFTCALKTQAMPKGYDCELKADKPGRARCNVRKFYFKMPRQETFYVPGHGHKKMPIKPKRVLGGPLSPDHHPVGGPATIIDYVREQLSMPSGVLMD